MRCQRCKRTTDDWTYLGGFILCYSCCNEALKLLATWIKQYEKGGLHAKDVRGKQRST